MRHGLRIIERKWVKEHVLGDCYVGEKKKKEVAESSMY